jgi:hypothetical protein
MEFNLAMLEAQLAEAKAHRIEAYKKRRAQIVERMKVANQGVPPVVGSDGSLHAPFDGYVAFSVKTEKAGVYGGGQYIPGSSDADAVERSPLVTRKINVPLSLFNEIKASKGGLFHLIRWEGKRSWVDRHYGIEVINVWFEADEWLVNQLEKFVYGFFDSLPVAEEPVKVKGLAPVGDHEVEGLVLSVKAQESAYGPSLKMLVELGNNATVWGTAPTALLSAAVEAGKDLRGAVVSFQASFTPAQDDARHAFFKRPKGAKVVRWPAA